MLSLQRRRRFFGIFLLISGGSIRWRWPERKLILPRYFVCSCIGLLTDNFWCRNRNHYWAIMQQFSYTLHGMNYEIRVVYYAIPSVIYMLRDTFTCVTRICFCLHSCVFVIYMNWLVCVVYTTCVKVCCF